MPVGIRSFGFADGCNHAPVQNRQETAGVITKTDKGDMVETGERK